MATVLLDTGVASFLHPKRRSSPQRTLYEPHLINQILAISFQTVAELYQWAEQNGWGPPQRNALELFIHRFVAIPYDAELARQWARLMVAARDRGRRLEAGDGWIAATAVRHQIPLITHDADFTQLSVLGLSVISHSISS